MTHRRHSEDRLARLGRPDPLKAVTGRSAIDDAIAATVDIIRRVDDQLVEPAPAPEVVVPHSAAAPVRQAEPRHHHAASSSRS